MAATTSDRPTIQQHAISATVNIHRRKLLTEMIPSSEPQFLNLLSELIQHADDLEAKIADMQKCEATQIVYGLGDKSPAWSAVRNVGHTHSAELSRIKELAPKKPCEHPNEFFQTYPQMPETAKCGKCNKTFIRKWAEA